MMFSFVRLQKQAQITAILDLFGEDSWRNVYAGELEVAPTRCAHHSQWSVD